MRRRDRDLARCRSVEHKVLLFKSNRYVYASLVKGGTVVGQVSTIAGAPDSIRNVLNGRTSKKLAKGFEYLTHGNCTT